METTEEKNSKELQNQKICPNCKIIYHKERSENCSNCGSKLIYLYKNCPHCKKRIEENAKFCPNCGYKLIKETGKKQNVNLLSFICILILGILFWGIILSDNKNTNNTTTKQQPDSIQLSIISDANISFEDLNALEETFQLTITEIKTGIIPVNPFQEAPIFVISFQNNKDKDVIWNSDKDFCKWRVVIGNEASPSYHMYHGPSLDDPISPNRSTFIDNAGLQVRIGSEKIKREDVLIEILNRDSKKVASFPAKKEFIKNMKSLGL